MALCPDCRTVIPCHCHLRSSTVTDQTATPPTEQQLDEITARAEGIASQLSGWLRRFGPIAGYESIDRARNVLTEDVPALLADLRRTRDRVAELEAYAYGCDAEGCVLPHSSWCDAAKKTAAENDGCTCGKPWTGHPQPHAMHCWTVNPPRAEVEEMRKRIAELSAEVSTGKAAPAPAAAPLSASPASSVSESAQSPTGAAEGALGDSSPTTPPRRTLTPNEYSAAWHAVEGAAGDEGADPGTVLHAVLNRLGIEWQDAAQPTA